MGGYQQLRCQGMAGVAEWTTREGLLEMTGKDPKCY